MNWRPILSYFALAASITAAQTTKPAVIEGVVTSFTDGQPIRKAVVTLREMRKSAVYLATADTAGQFRFGDVQPGRYQIYAERQGYIMAAARSSPAIIVADEQHSNSARIELMPLGVISGRVLDSDGDPISGAQVRAFRFTYDQPTRQVHYTGSSTTNDLGEYEIADLVPSRYYVLVKTPPGSTTLPGRVRTTIPEEAYPVAFYPGVSDLTQASPAEVVPGARGAGIDFRLKKAPAYHIRGRVEEGNTSQTIEVRSTSATSPIEPLLVTRTQPDGAFDFPGVTSGSYRIAVGASPRQVVTITDSSVDGVLLTLSAPDLSLEGTVRVEDQRAVDLRSVLIGLDPVDPGVSGRANVQTNGSFGITGLAAAIYRLDVIADAIPGSYLKSIRLAGQDVRTGIIDLTHGGGRLDLVFGNDSGQLQGSVQNENGEPVGDVLITVLPDDEYQHRTDLFKAARTTNNGSFSFENLAPGDYKVWGWQERPMNLTPSAEMRKAFEARAVSVSIKPGARERVQLKPISPEEFEAARKKLP